VKGTPGSNPALPADANTAIPLLAAIAAAKSTRNRRDVPTPVMAFISATPSNPLHARSRVRPSYA
jgi:hypothetical protein